MFCLGLCSGSHPSSITKRGATVPKHSKALGVATASAPPWPKKPQNFYAAANSGIQAGLLFMLPLFHHESMPAASRWPLYVPLAFVFALWWAFFCEPWFFPNEARDAAVYQGTVAGFAVPYLLILDSQTNHAFLLPAFVVGRAISFFVLCAGAARPDRTDALRESRGHRLVDGQGRRISRRDGLVLLLCVLRKVRLAANPAPSSRSRLELAA